MAERVILEAISAKHASDWLTVTPSPGLGFRFLPEEFQTLVKMRLRLPLYADGISCPLCTDRTLDKLGYHAVTCGRGPDVVSRHNALRDYLYNVCRQAGFCPALEQGAGLDGTRTRPADILIPTWSLGRAGAIDVTCTNLLTPTHLTGATVSVTDCLESAERKKQTKTMRKRSADENDDKCHELNWTCLPVATTPYGGFGIESSKTLKRIAMRVALQGKESRSHSARRLYGGLAVVLARSAAL